MVPPGPQTTTETCVMRARLLISVTNQKQSEKLWVDTMISIFVTDFEYLVIIIEMISIMTSQTCTWYVELWLVILVHDMCNYD